MDNDENNGRRSKERVNHLKVHTSDDDNVVDNGDSEPKPTPRHKFANRNLHTRNLTEPALKVTLGPPGGDVRNVKSSNVVNWGRKSMFSDAIHYLLRKLNVEGSNSKVNSDEESDDEDGNMPGVSMKRRKGTAGASIQDFTDKSNAKGQGSSLLQVTNEIQQPTATTSDSKPQGLQESIQKWRVMKASENKMKLDSIAIDSNHQYILEDAARRAQVEVPIPLQTIVKEEALGIVSQTEKLYRGYLGSKNQMTKDATKRKKEIYMSLYGDADKMPSV